MLKKVSNSISQEEFNSFLNQIVYSIKEKKLNRLLIIPPDHTRLFSRAGNITEYLYFKLNQFLKIDIMPALGTHKPMTETELKMMFGKKIPIEAFLIHNWRKDIIKIGSISTKEIKNISNEKFSSELSFYVNKKIFSNQYDLILSIGQVVPHEVIGMANYTKNILIGIGGGDTIQKSHFMSAVIGIEKIVGVIDNPVRYCIDEGFNRFLKPKINVEFILTVLKKETNKVDLKGIFWGSNKNVFQEASLLSQKNNIEYLDKPITKAIAFLDPREFHSTWLGNKAIYRLRKAMERKGTLIILAPGLTCFGEDEEIDKLIRQYGYKGTDYILKQINNPTGLIKSNLSAAAHLIHGSTEGRFEVIYCTSKKNKQIDKKTIEKINFKHAYYEDMIKKYPIEKYSDGWNQMQNEEIYYVSNPALGLWDYK